MLQKPLTLEDHQKTYRFSLELLNGQPKGPFCLCISALPFQKLYDSRSDFLHSIENGQLLSFPSLERQYSYLLGRYCAKKALGAFLQEQDLWDIEIENGIFDQPVARCSSLENIHVSISHTYQLGAALAFPEICPMAIDMETICASKVAVMRSQMLPGELIFHCFYSREAQDTAMWTAKEALSKALKCGLTVPVPILEIESMEEEQGLVVSYFKNFKQYKAVSFQVESAICSIVFPSTIQINWDF